MTVVIAYAVIVAALSAVLCGHHGEDGRAVGRAVFRWRTPCPSWARGPIGARRYAHRTQQKRGAT